MNKADVNTVKSTLSQEQELDMYKLYNDADIDTLIAEIEQILNDGNELKNISANQYYSKNIYDLVLFIYNKALSQTEAKTTRHPSQTKHKLLSKDSLNTLYSFAS